MITKLFALKDTKLCYLSPFVQANEAVAVRSVCGAMREPDKNVFNTDIEDKELWLLGTYDDETGIIKPDLKFVIGLKDLKEL